MARFHNRSELGRAGIPVCAMWDEVQMGQSATLNNGVQRNSNFLKLVGYRRYRLKFVQLTGAGPTAVSILDIPFSQIVANAWETVVVGAAIATGTRTVYNFGEGTANLTNFMGPFLIVSLTNNGANPATYQLELWGQA